MGSLSCCRCKCLWGSGHALLGAGGPVALLFIISLILGVPALVFLVVLFINSKVLVLPRV